MKISCIVSKMVYLGSYHVLAHGGGGGWWKRGGRVKIIDSKGGIKKK